jgi:hypothetical protein
VIIGAGEKRRNGDGGRSITWMNEERRRRIGSRFLWCNSWRHDDRKKTVTVTGKVCYGDRKTLVTEAGKDLEGV